MLSPVLMTVCDMLLSTRLAFVAETEIALQAERFEIGPVLAD